VLKREARGTGSPELLIEVSCVRWDIKILKREPRRLLNRTTDSGHCG
jgi:hypothetical protein